MVWLGPEPLVLVTLTEYERGFRRLLRLLGTSSPLHAISSDAGTSKTAYLVCRANRSDEPEQTRRASEPCELPGTRQLTTKLQLFLAFLLPSAEPASISTVWGPEESLRGVKLKLPVVRRY